MGLTISLSRVSILPPPARNNIFYEIETSSTGLYNTGLGAQCTGRGVVLAKKQFSATVSFSASAREFSSDFFTIIKGRCTNPSY
jgi:hypothetical protein